MQPMPINTLPRTKTVAGLELIQTCPTFPVTCRIAHSASGHSWKI